MPAGSDERRTHRSLRSAASFQRRSTALRAFACGENSLSCVRSERALASNLLEKAMKYQIKYKYSLRGGAVLVTDETLPAFDVQHTDPSTGELLCSSFDTQAEVDAFVVGKLNPFVLTYTLIGD